MAAHCVLIAAISGRALAEAARRSGYIPLVADLFGDADTGDCAAASLTVKGDVRTGFDAGDLIETLEKLEYSFSVKPIGLVYGAGFEKRPELLDALSKRWTILGNLPETVAELKNPMTFQTALRACGIPHPKTMIEPPKDGEWLVKDIGGAGGGHIRRARDAIRRCGTYYQEQVKGRAVSALFVANGNEAAVIGFSQPWTSPGPDTPFRYGGAAQPAEENPERLEAFAEAIRTSTRRFRLRGLNSADFVSGESGWWLLEINPRPGATLDIFDNDAIHLFARHLEGTAGMHAQPFSPYEETIASGIVYAEGDAFTVGCWQALPGWIKDRPRPGTVIGANQPICTVLAKASTVSQARSLCAERGGLAKNYLTGNSNTNGY